MTEVDELTEKAVEAGLRAGHSQTQPTRFERSQNLHFILGEPDADLRRLARFMRWADCFAQEYAEAAVRAAVDAVADPLRAEGARAEAALWRDQIRGHDRSGIMEFDREEARREGRVEGARQVLAAVEKYAAHDHLPSVRFGAGGARDAAREAVARIEKGEEN